MALVQALTVYGLTALALVLLAAVGFKSFQLVRERRKRVAIEAIIADLRQAQEAAEADRFIAEQRRIAADRASLAIQERYKDVLNIEEEVRRLDIVTFGQRDEIETLQAKHKAQSATYEVEHRKKIDGLQAEYKTKREIYNRLVKEVAIFDERLAFAEMGVYEPHFDFTDSERYKGAILVVRDKQKQMISGGKAAFSSTQWTVEGSAARGKAMMDRNVRLTLRAFNNECDAAIANTRWNNVNAMEKRIERARDQINKLNESNTTLISAMYFDLKMQELRLTHEYREKLKAEREERTEIARQAREEQKLVRDLEEAQENEERQAELLAKARAEAANAGAIKLAAFTEQIKLLERQLSEAQAKRERAQALAERTRSGYVYIISNVGSFGEDIIKIGLTRRADPMDRVRELSDASVPFKFDIHAIIYSDDAPKLERALHTEFDEARVNSRNIRKEFFRASLNEVEEALKRLSPDAAFIRDIEAQEYRETIAQRQALLTQDNVPQETRLPVAL
jgi:hypothetical protein